MNNKKKPVFDFGDVLVLVGIGLVANGFWVIYPPLSFIFVGIVIMACGLRLGRDEND